MRFMNRLYRLLFTVLTPTKSDSAVRLGSEYGGWHIPAGGIASDAVVYSAGLGEDATFDLELIVRYGCDVWAFDPTPRAIAFSKSIKEKRFHFLSIGLWSADGPQQFFPPREESHVSHSITNIQGTSDSTFEAMCRSLPSLMHELGHVRIDLLKLDIEGAEYEVLRPVLRGEITPTILAVEFHLASLSGLRETIRLIRTLQRQGYSVLAREGWDVTLVNQAGALPRNSRRRRNARHD
jgi:FkbM family methyltransferase